MDSVRRSASNPSAQASQRGPGLNIVTWAEEHGNLQLQMDPYAGFFGRKKKKRKKLKLPSLKGLPRHVRKYIRKVDPMVLPFVREMVQVKPDNPSAYAAEFYEKGSPRTRSNRKPESKASVTASIESAADDGRAFPSVSQPMQNEKDNSDVAPALQNDEAKADSKDTAVAIVKPDVDNETFQQEAVDPVMLPMLKALFVALPRDPLRFVKEYTRRAREAEIQKENRRKLPDRETMKEHIRDLFLEMDGDQVT